MRLHGKIRLLAALGAVFVGMGTSSAIADDEVATLKRMLAEQQRVIESIKAQLDKVTADQQKTKSQLERVAASPAAAAPSAATTTAQAPVTQDQVEKTIEAFERQPSHKYALTGFGTVGFADSKGSPSTFYADFNPTFNYRVTDQLVFNGEVEAKLREDGAEFDIEQAELDYFLHDNLIITAGKFLMPFNTFSLRNHPGWINKLPSFPSIYEDETPGGHPGTISLLTTVGVQAHGGVDISDESMINYALYLSNGPKNVAADGDKPELSFGDNTQDNNDNKAFGGRIGVLPIPELEVGWSGVGGTYAGNESSFFWWGDDASFRLSGFELRGEYVNAKNDLGDGTSETHDGFYVQTSFRPGKTEWSADWPLWAKNLEPVVRVGSAETNDGDYDQLVLGVDYWLTESTPLKVAYEFNDGDGDLGNDRVLVQAVHGF